MSNGLAVLIKFQWFNRIECRTVCTVSRIFSLLRVDCFFICGASLGVKTAERSSFSLFLFHAATQTITKCENQNIYRVANVDTNTILITSEPANSIIKIVCMSEYLQSESTSIRSQSNRYDMYKCVCYVERTQCYAHIFTLYNSVFVQFNRGAHKNTRTHTWMISFCKCIDFTSFK